jgi:hypothetical protein
MKITKSIATILLATLTAGILGGCIVETGHGWRHRHGGVIVVR